MASNRVGGIIEIKVNGQIIKAKGNFTYNLGRLKSEAVVGEDGVHGFMSKPQVPFIEGETTDSSDLDLSELLDTSGATVYLSLANGKLIVLKDATQTGEGTGNTQEGNVSIRFEGMSAEEVR